MRLTIVTDEIETDDQMVNYVDSVAFARIWFIVMENKHQRRAAELLRASENEQDAIDDIDQRIVDAELKMFPWGKNDAS